MILAIIGIFTYGTDNFPFLKLKEEIISSAYSQPCNPLEVQVNNPKIRALDIFPFKVDPVLLDQLLELKIVMDPSFNTNEQICYNLASKIYEVRKTDGTSAPPINKLKLEVKSNKLKANYTYNGSSTIDLKNVPIIEVIDNNNNGILNSLENNCTIEQNKINCNKGTTKLTINKNNEKIFVGESTKPNGIIIIFDKTGSNNPVNVEVCEKEKKGKFSIFRNSVIEVDCV